MRFWIYLSNELSECVVIGTRIVRYLVFDKSSMNDSSAKLKLSQKNLQPHFARKTFWKFQNLQIEEKQADENGVSCIFTEAMKKWQNVVCHVETYFNSHIIKQHFGMFVAFSSSYLTVLFNMKCGNWMFIRVCYI